MIMHNPQKITWIIADLESNFWQTTRTEIHLLLDVNRSNNDNKEKMYQLYRTNNVRNTSGNMTASIYDKITFLIREKYFLEWR